MSLVQNKVVLVTGASRGIGRAIATTFAKAGANVAFTYLSSVEKGQALEQELAAFGITAKGYRSDASSYTESEKLVEDVLADFGTIDILINNAGFGKWTKFLDQSIETYNEMITLNIINLTMLCHLFLPKMVSNQKGIIINISSTGAFQPLPYIAVYGATKSYVLHFTEALAGEYRSSGIKCLAVCPGNTDTNFTQVANADTHGMSSSSVEEVVLATITALDKSKSTMIVGCRNYLTAQLPRVLSREQVIKLVGGMLRTRLSNNPNISENT